MTTSNPNRFVVPILSGANFVVGMGAFVIIGILNPLAEAFDLSTSSAGSLMVVYSITYAILSPLLVALTGHIGRRRVLAAAMTVFALSALMSALAPTAPWLFAGRVVAAIGAGMLTPVGAAVAVGLSPPERQGAALASVFLGLSLSQVAGVPLGSYLAYTFGWRIAFWMVVALAVPCIWLIWTRVPAGLQFTPVTLTDLGRVLRNGKLMLAVSFTTVFLGASYIVFTFITPLLTTTMGFGRDGLTIFLSLAGIGGVVGAVLGGRMADRIGALRTLAFLSSIQILIMPFFSTLPMPVLAVGALAAIWSTFSWSFMAAQQLRLIGLSPENASVLLALNAGAVYIGAAMGSAIGGTVLDIFDLNALGIAGAIGSAMALVVLLISHVLSRQPTP